MREDLTLGLFVAAFIILIGMVLKFAVGKTYTATL